MNNNYSKEIQDLHKQLSASIDNLEENIINRLENNDISAKIIDFNTADNSELQAKIIEQQKIIEKLNQELNKAQKTIQDIGKENDFLKDKNRLFADKIFKFKSQGSKIILEVEDQIEQVKNIIKHQIK